jgi:hypothetical protein
VKRNAIWMGFDIQTASGPVLQPTQIRYWKDNQFKNKNPEAPFHYKADALLGLSLIHLNKHLQNPFSSPKMNFSFAHESWLALEPHHEMFSRALPRMRALKEKIKGETSPDIRRFEDSFTEILNTSLQPWGLDLGELTGLVKAIDFLETQLSSPLLFNFKVSFGKDFAEKLHYLHSLLFNLRALIAMDYNAYIQDPTFEAVRVDSISDYLPKSEYVANDSLMYWQFIKLQEELGPQNFKKMSDIFAHYSHNATCLIENLPKSFLHSIPAGDLENTLYLVQMDWLLGTDCGLLFKIREELFGIIEGYEHVFWTDLDGKPHQPAHALSVNCQVTENDLSPQTAAA